MKILALATTLLALFPAAHQDTPAPQANPEDQAESIWEYLLLKYDADGDGRVSKKEYTRDAEHWKRLDKNGDGMLEKDEFAGSSRSGRKSRGSRKDKPVEAPRTGQQAPDFELLVLPRKAKKESAGKQPKKAPKPEFVKLSSFKGKRPVALVFGSYT